MSATILAAAFVGPSWPGKTVFALSGLFGLSAYCWAGIGLAEAVETPERPGRIVFGSFAA
jgi:hypothetical protein